MCPLRVGHRDGSGDLSLVKIPRGLCQFHFMVKSLLPPTLVSFYSPCPTRLLVGGRGSRVRFRMAVQFLSGITAAGQQQVEFGRGVIGKARLWQGARMKWRKVARWLVQERRRTTSHKADIPAGPEFGERSQRPVQSRVIQEAMRPCWGWVQGRE